MGLKNLRNLPVNLDPTDHGYGDRVPAEPGEVVVELDEPACIDCGAALPSRDVSQGFTTCASCARARRDCR